MRKLSCFGLGLGLLSLAAPAFAHPGHDPASAGFLAGIAHPLLGLDHLLAMLVVGVWAAQAGGRARWFLPASFLALMACGALVAAGLFFGSIASAQVAAEQSWPTREWPTSSPEAEGMDSADLARLISFGATRSFDSLLIARHGRIVLDAYYAPYTADIPHAINSATKAVVGTLIAMLHRDGLLDRLDHPMLDFFSDRDIANVDARNPRCSKCAVESGV